MPKEVLVVCGIQKSLLEIASNADGNETDSQWGSTVKKMRASLPGFS